MRYTSGNPPEGIAANDFWFLWLNSYGLNLYRTLKLLRERRRKKPCAVRFERRLMRYITRSKDGTTV